ncbi:MAG: hypothetical protein AAF899_06740 [Pseudomonadota bacterium]
MQALGVSGGSCFYMDLLGQLREITRHDKQAILSIFMGQERLLWEAFPRYNKDGDPIGWEGEPAGAAMMRACAERGIWSEMDRLRGLGAWADQDGELVLHCGDGVLHKGEWRPPGDIEGHVYPALPKIPRPLAPDADTEGVADELHRLLDSWEWDRQDDAWLLMGWIGCALFGGALKWRPLMWVTGGPGSGKSTLQDVIFHVLGGEGAVLHSSDATAASLWQTLTTSSRAVVLDEIEPDVDNRQRMLGVIKLARQAASGGNVMRGSADHKSTEFKARSCFLFSSVLVPTMLDQDISRMALMELHDLPRDAPPPKIVPSQLKRCGQALRRRILDGWPRWHETLELYRQALAHVGHGARGSDQFGTLLAMADLMLEDELPTPERCGLFASKLSAQAVNDQMDQAQDWQRLAAHWLTQHVEVWRGGHRMPLSMLMQAAADLPSDPEDGGDRPAKGEARKRLREHGLIVEGEKDRARLLVANRHHQLSRLSQDTHWHAGAGQTGVWRQSLLRVPGANVPKKSFSFDGHKQKCVAVPLLTFLEGLSGPPDAPHPDST